MNEFDAFWESKKRNQSYRSSTSLSKMMGILIFILCLDLLFNIILLFGSEGLDVIINIIRIAITIFTIFVLKQIGNLSIKTEEMVYDYNRKINKLELRIKQLENKK